MAELPENDRIAGPFIAADGQTDFPADFPVIDAGALRVRRERAGVIVVLSPPAVSAETVTAEAFTARLVTPSEAGDRLFVYSELTAERLRQHTPNGAVRSATLEGDAVEFQAQLQERKRDQARTLAVPFGEQGFELPPLAQRTGKLGLFTPAGLQTFDHGEVVVTTNALGQAVALPLTALHAAIGTDLLDDGEWLAAQDPASNDDGVWG